jgi:hypothetical protein
MSSFWFAKTGTKAGQYAIGLGNIEVIVVSAPDDVLGSQWAQCCAAALNAREHKLRLAAISTETNDAPPR